LMPKSGEILTWIFSKTRSRINHYEVSTTDPPASHTLIYLAQKSRQDKSRWYQEVMVSKLSHLNPYLNAFVSTIRCWCSQQQQRRLTRKGYQRSLWFTVTMRVRSRPWLVS